MENSEGVQMKVFLSWSGARSRAIAEALREWLPNVIQAVEPWMSAEDVDKGLRWSSEIAVQLEGTRFGIICLTPDNLESPWILFEAGALSKTIDKAFVCPFLFGLDPSDVKGPLAQFQATKAEKDDTKRLITTINNALGDQALAAQKIETAFEHWWRDLEWALRSVKEIAGDAKPERSDREILEEVLELVRSEARDSRAFSERRDDSLRAFSEMLDVAMQSDQTGKTQLLIAAERLKRAAWLPSLYPKRAVYERVHRPYGAPVVAIVAEQSAGLFRVMAPGSENSLGDFAGLDLAQSYADETVEDLYPHNCSEERCHDWRMALTPG